MRFSRFLPLLLISIASAFGSSPLQEKVRAWRVAHERAIIDEYREFVAIPNIAIDRDVRDRDELAILVDDRTLVGHAPGAHFFLERRGAEGRRDRNQQQREEAGEPHGRVAGRFFADRRGARE